MRKLSQSFQLPNKTKVIISQAKVDNIIKNIKGIFSKKIPLSGRSVNAACGNIHKNV